MKTKKLFLRAMQICMLLAMFCVFYACSEEDVVPEPDPTEDPVPAGDDGDVEFDITNTSNGSGEGGSSGESGSGTSPDDPAVATSDEGVNMTISQKSSYKDPNGTTYTCEPKATISLYADLDTVYAKDIETLTKVIGTPKVTTGNTGTNPVEYTTDQIFNVGGQNVNFNLAYEVFTHTNSEKQKIEMPYVKVNNANFGASTPTETEPKSKSAETTSVRLADISVKPVKNVMSRSISVTDTTTYEVTARFNLDVESKNSANDSKQTLSFEVKYFAVITETTEYAGAELSTSITKNGEQTSVTDYYIGAGETLNLVVTQNSSYTDQKDTLAGTLVTKINISSLDSLAIKAQSDLTTEAVQKAVAISYEGLTEKLEDPLPYYSFGKVTYVENEIETVEKTETKEVYKVVATYNQVAKPVNVETATTQPSDLKFTYTVEFYAVVKIEPVTLVETKYRQSYEWLPPHDNIPWRYRFIVYRDRIYSNGETVTDTFTTVNRIVEIDFNVASSGNTFTVLSEIDDYMNVNATDTLSYHTFAISDISDDISAITGTEIQEPRMVLGSYDLNAYTNETTRELFSDSQVDGGWYYTHFGYKASSLIFVNGVLEINTYPGIVTYRYFLYLDGKQFVCETVDESSYKFSFALEDDESESRGKVKVLKHKFGLDWLGKHCRVEVTDTIF